MPLNCDMETYASRAAASLSSALYSFCCIISLWQRGSRRCHKPIYDSILLSLMHIWEDARLTVGAGDQTFNCFWYKCNWIFETANQRCGCHWLMITECQCQSFSWTEKEKWWMIIGITDTNSSPLRTCLMLIHQTTAEQVEKLFLWYIFQLAYFAQV